MLTATGAKLLDFGLAKLVSSDDGAGAAHGMLTTQSALLTGRGVFAGTAAYMSPEQANGAEIDSRSDLFAFGAVLYEMVTGTAAFARESTLSSLTAVVRDTPAPVSDRVRGVPEELDRVIVMCLQKDPARRFQHAGDIKVLLEHTRERPGSGARSGRRVVLLVMALLAVIAGGIAVAIRYSNRSETSTQVAELAQTGFTFDDGMTMYPAMSRDGKLAAFASDRSGEGHLDIYVQQTAGTPAIRRTNDPAHDVTPSFSPDGSRIAYVDPSAAASRASEGLSIVSADGGLPARLDPDFVASGGPGFSWSPDGKYVLRHGYRKSTRDSAGSDRRTSFRSRSPRRNRSSISTTRGAICGPPPSPAGANSGKTTQAAVAHASSQRSFWLRSRGTPQQRVCERTEQQCAGPPAQPVENRSRVDAKSTRPPLPGKLQNSFPQLPQALFSFTRGHFYFVKNGDIPISL